jgi:membrane protease YdiL (CAAX protease family)
MSRRARAKQLASSGAKAFLAVVWAYAWMIPMALALGMAPPAAAAAMVATVGAFLARNVVRPLRSRRRLAARLRLRPFGRYLPLLTMAVGAKLVLMLAGFVLHEEIASRRVLPRLPEDPELVSDAFMVHPLGATALLLAIVVLAPLIEEFAFRGKMQRELEHSLGIAAAIVVPAVLFSAMHGRVDAIHHLPYGLFAGWVVWRTGSIWGAVYMHAVNNAVAGGALYLPDRWPTGKEVPAGLWPLAIVAGIAALGALSAIAARVHTIANRTRPVACAWPLGRVAHADAATARG